MNILHKVTLRYLKENRTRTLVTIIGIILSAAMFTGVTTSISSLQNYLINSTIYSEGNWYGAACGLSAEQKEQLLKDSRTEAAVSLELLGFAELKDSINDDKPYLCVQGIQTDFTEMMPIHLLEGRLPENNHEILLPEHLKDNGGIDWAMGDKLSLQLCTLVNNLGEPMTTNQKVYMNDEDSDEDDDNDEDGLTERLVSGKVHHYTVVGIYERPNYEDYAAPGYTALTIGENSHSHSYSLYLRTAPGKNAANTIKEMFDEIDGIAWELNYSLLRIYGYSGESPYNRVLYTLGAILILIIMFGSISLIYNAFSISVSERTKQFGLLASIGATKRQLINSVVFESLFLSLIGIPLGILSGLAGIGITFYFVRDMLANMMGFYGSSYQAVRFATIFGPAKHISLGLHPSAGALTIAVFVALLTVLISAYIPARRAMKKSAIDAIRQSNDISIRARKVKTSRLTQKLFGFEGTLATKNYKRGRRKYRATVISLFLSVVLFISTSSFCAYLSVSTGTVLGNKSFDISYVLDPDSGISPDGLLSDLSQSEGVTASTYAIRKYFSCAVKTSDFDQGLRDYWKREEEEEMGNEYHEYDDTSMDVMLIFLADKEFCNYLDELNLSGDDFFDPKNPKAVAADSLRLYSGTDQKYHQFSALAGGTQSEVNLYLARKRENYDSGGIYRDENGAAVCDFYHLGTDDGILTLPREEACFKLPLALGAVAQQAPAFFPDDDDMIRLFYPYSMLDAVFAGLEDGVSYYAIQDVLMEETRTELFFQCKNHTAVATDMTKRLQTRGLNSTSLTDYAMSLESDRAMMTVVNVFSYGFITLISLIAAANVFNTISTNINLRRREFAMLKSIGMTPKAFSKMMNFECLLYGFKGLLYGLPVSILITRMIYNSVGQGLEMRFFIPWYSIVIAVGSVFLVVFITMLYSMKRIRRENTIDTLKNENL